MTVLGGDPHSERTALDTDRIKIFVLQNDMNDDCIILCAPFYDYNSME